MTRKSEYTVIYNEYNSMQLPEGSIEDLKKIAKDIMAFREKYNIDPRDLRLIVEEEIWFECSEYILRNMFAIHREKKGETK